jgi:hypothetical protein
MSFSLFSIKLADLKEPLNPHDMLITQTAIYIVDEQKVLAYSPTDFSLKTTFGNPGEGPGEILIDPENVMQLQVNEANVFIHSSFKVLWYQLNGTFVGEKKIPYFCFQIIPLADKFVINRLIYQNNTSFFEVIITNQNFEFECSLYKRQRIHPTVLKKLLIPQRLVYCRVHNHQLFIHDQLNSLFMVFNSLGRQLKSIPITLPEIKVSEEYKEDFLKEIQLDKRFKNSIADIRKLLEFEDRFPTIRNFLVADNTFFIQTYEQNNQKHSRFFWLNDDGHILKKTFLPNSDSAKLLINPVATYTIYNNSYFYLRENPQTQTWELHTIKDVFPN